ncbi:MAG TPA: type II toxin-antitoxin system VapC family toxin [Pirellulales bacterium]|nr:type II toxin-antitoxin system VapC family toxin [Pirellulales bacterium]
MSFLLDTDHLSAHVRRPAGLMHRFVQHSGRLYTSTIALAELYVWAYGRPDPAPALASVEKMLFHEVSLVEYDNDCGKEFGRVRVEMRRQGLEVPSLDLLIASVALVYDLTLVTHNTVDFQNIPGLGLDDWLAP